jgi:hypothetical protein
VLPPHACTRAGAFRRFPIASGLAISTCHFHMGFIVFITVKCDLAATFAVVNATYYLKYAKKITGMLRFHINSKWQYPAIAASVEKRKIPP